MRTRKCKCDRPKRLTAELIEHLKEVSDHDPTNVSCVGISTTRCTRCDQQWIVYDAEEPHVSKSDRWYRARIDREPTAEGARAAIEAAEYCFASGWCHRPNDETGKKLYRADGTERKREGSRWNAPITVT